jgi:hypothetical protein
MFDVYKKRQSGGQKGCFVQKTVKTGGFEPAELKVTLLPCKRLNKVEV